MPSLSPEEMSAMIPAAGLSAADQFLRMNKEEIEKISAMIQTAGLSAADQFLRMNKEEIEKISASFLKSLEISPEMQKTIDDIVRGGCPRPSLDPEVIEMFQELHGEMDIRFKAEEDVQAFYEVVNGPDFFEEELGKFQLGDCFEAPKYMWPDDDEEAYWYMNITSYGRGVINLLKTLEVI